MVPGCVALKARQHGRQQRKPESCSMSLVPRSRASTAPAVQPPKHARQLRALKALKDSGVSMDRVAHRLLMSQGRVPTMAARQRIAAGFRKQLSRAGVTRRHVVHPAIDGAAEAAPVPLTNQPTKEASTMPEPKL